MFTLVIYIMHIQLFHQLPDWMLILYIFNETYTICMFGYSQTLLIIVIRFDQPHSNFIFIINSRQYDVSFTITTHSICSISLCLYYYKQFCTLELFMKYV